MKKALMTIILVLTATAAAAGDPFAGMRGIPIMRSGPEGKSVFFVGVNSRWETRTPSGALMSSGSYALAGHNTICFRTDAGQFTSERPDCMRYAGDRQRGIVTALWNGKGQRIWLAAPKLK